ncbi:MAG: type II secretion system protein J [Phycisphaeraceae bacterium]
MMHPNRSRISAGYTLIEMVLSLALLSIVMVSAGSAMLFAVNAAPNADNPATHKVRDAQLIARITADLAQAKYVIEKTSQAVTIVVPDRDGDKIPDRIRYAWSGTPGDPLTIQFNDETATPIASAVDAFALEYRLANKVTSIPAPLIFGPEKVVRSFESTGGSSEADVTATDAFGQLVQPIISFNALGFMPTRLEIYAKEDKPDDGFVAVELRNTTLSGPGADLYATAVINEDELKGGYEWKSFTIVPEQLYIPIGQNLTMTFTHSAGSDISATLGYGTNLLSGLIESTDSAATWSPRIGNRLLYRLYGQEVSLGGADINVTREHVEAIQVTIQGSGSSATPLQSTERLFQCPEIIDTFWECDFNTSPTAADLNGDGVADWIYDDNSDPIPDDKIIDGSWNADGKGIHISPADQLDAPTIVDFRMTTSNRATCKITGPLHINSSGDVLPMTVVLSDAGDGTQHLTFYNDLEEKTPYGTVPGLSTGWIDVKIMVLPNTDTIALWVNGNLIGSALFQRVPDLGEEGLKFWGDKRESKFNRIRVTVGGVVSQ